MRRLTASLVVVAVLAAGVAAGATYQRHPDIAADHWAVDYIQWVTEEGFVAPRSDGTFDPNGPLTRAQFAKALYRYHQAYINTVPTHTHATTTHSHRVPPHTHPVASHTHPGGSHTSRMDHDCELSTPIFGNRISTTGPTSQSLSGHYHEVYVGGVSFPFGNSLTSLLDVECEHS